MDLKMKRVTIGHCLATTPNENIVATVKTEQKRTLNNEPWKWILSSAYEFGGTQSYLRHMECKTLGEALEILQELTDKHGLVAR